MNSKSNKIFCIRFVSGSNSQIVGFFVRVCARKIVFIDISIIPVSKVRLCQFERLRHSIAHVANLQMDWNVHTNVSVRVIQFACRCLTAGDLCMLPLERQRNTENAFPLAVLVFCFIFSPSTRFLAFRPKAKQIYKYSVADAAGLHKVEMMWKAAATIILWCLCI